MEADAEKEGALAPTWPSARPSGAEARELVGAMEATATRVDAPGAVEMPTGVLDTDNGGSGDRPATHADERGLQCGRRHHHCAYSYCRGQAGKASNARWGTSHGARWSISIVMPEAARDARRGAGDGARWSIGVVVPEEAGMPIRALATELAVATAAIDPPCPGTNGGAPGGKK